MPAPVRPRVGVRARPWRAARLLLAALLVPLDEHVLLEQIDVVEGLEQVGRLAQQRLVRVRDRVRGGVRGRVRVKVRVGVTGQSKGQGQL